MNKNAKRLLCLALCLMMVLSVLPLTALAADETLRVYCQAPEGWTKCNAYWWGSTTGPNPGWPGEAMKTDRYGIWYIDIPADTPNIIFNNGSGKQSADLTVPTDDKVMFVYNTNTWAVYGKQDVEEPVEADYYVAGDAALCGVSWDPAASANGMTDEDKDGIYTKTYTNVATGTYELKVTDGTWNNSWGQGGGQSNYVLTIEVDNATVEVRFDSNTKQLTVVVNGKEPDVVTGFYVAGTMNEWQAADPAFKMSEDLNGFYVISFEITAGQHSLKVTDGTWNNSWGGSGADGNYEISAIADGTVTVTFDTLNYVVMVSGDCLEEINPEPLEIYSVHVVGGLGLTGADWDVTANEMIASGSVYTLTLDNVPSGQHEFKFAANGDWLINWGAGVEMVSGEIYEAWFSSLGNNIINITSESASVTFTLDLTDMDIYTGNGGKCSVVIEGEGGDVPVVPDGPAYYVAGDFNDWKENDEAYKMVAGENGYYTLSFDVTEGEHAAKVTDGTWDNSWGGLGEGGNYEFVAVTDGSVTVLFDSNNYVVDIFGDCLGEIELPDFYVAGEFNGWSCNDAAYMMTPGIEGCYIYNMAVTPGDYAVKVTDGTWDNSWGGLGENGNYEFTVVAEGTVTICFYPSTHTLEVIGDCLAEPVATDFYVAGEFNGWKENDIAYKMIAGENGIYTLEMNLTAGSYGLKVTDGTWDNSWGGLGEGGNYEFILASDCRVTVTFDSVNKTVLVDGDFAQEPETELEINGVYAVGAAGLTGVEWDPTKNQMTGENGIYTITFSDVAAGTYEVKFAANGAWEISWGTGEELVSGESYAAWFNGGNSQVVVAEDGSEVVLTLDLSAMDTITGEGAVCSATIIPPSAEWGVAVSGTVTSGKKTLTDVTVELWAEGASKAAYTTTAVDGAYTINNVAAGTYTVKVSKTNYVTRNYELTVGYEDATLDVQICLLGDVNMDGSVNILDVAKAYAHVKGNKLTDDYAIECANVNGGSSVAITDVANLYAHTKGTKKLY